MAVEFRDAYILNPSFVPTPIETIQISHLGLTGNSTQIYKAIMLTPGNITFSTESRKVNDYDPIDFYRATILVPDSIINREPY